MAKLTLVFCTFYFIIFYPTEGKKYLISTRGNKYLIETEDNNRRNDGRDYTKDQAQDYAERPYADYTVSNNSSEYGDEYGKDGYDEEKDDSDELNGFGMLTNSSIEEDRGPRNPYKCKTNEDGPESFKRCATKWVMGRNGGFELDDYGEYPMVGSLCDKSKRPPSYDDEVCKVFHEEIKELKATKSRANMTEQFVKHFLKSKRPKEAAIITEDALRNITNAVRNNRTHCFPTDIGKYGWCGTCQDDESQVNPAIVVSLDTQKI